MLEPSRELIRLRRTFQDETKHSLLAIIDRVVSENSGCGNDSFNLSLGNYVKSLTGRRYEDLHENDVIKLFDILTSSELINLGKKDTFDWLHITSSEIINHYLESDTIKVEDLGLIVQELTSSGMVSFLSENDECKYNLEEAIELSVVLKDSLVMKPYFKMIASRENYGSETESVDKEIIKFAKYVKNNESVKSLLEMLSNIEDKYRMDVTDVTVNSSINSTNYEKIFLPLNNFLRDHPKTSRFRSFKKLVWKSAIEYQDSDKLVSVLNFLDKVVDRKDFSEISESFDDLHYTNEGEGLILLSKVYTKCLNNERMFSEVNKTISNHDLNENFKYSYLKILNNSMVFSNYSFPLLYNYFVSETPERIKDSELKSSFSLMEVNNVMQAYNIISGSTDHWKSYEKIIAKEIFFGILNRKVATGSTIKEKKHILNEWSTNAYKLIRDNPESLNFMRDAA